MRYFLEISYLGTNYHGWQIQPNSITIQGVLEDCVSKLLKLKIKLVGAGRTDTGVHANQMFAHFDIDDKINNKSLESGRPIDVITSETIKWYLEDMAALGNLEPNLMPRATDYIPQMINYIELLIKRGFAYPAEGHVLFSVSHYKNYGRLSGRSVEEMIAGARVEVASYKRHPMDFVLWKPSENDLPGWESPWGRGRPGWHIECSAMAHDLLGATFDIHGGGNDLQFPHHENEIAQSCCAYPESEFARYWLHNEMLQVDGKKMSKSLGNFFTVRDLLDQGYPGEVIRFVFLSTHYSKPMDWNNSKALEAKNILRKWRGLLKNNLVHLKHSNQNLILEIFLNQVLRNLIVRFLVNLV